MNKNWYLLAVIIGMATTMLFAARHELGWTGLGILCVGCNLYNYLNG
jgi:hypothetical protein